MWRDAALRVDLAQNGAYADVLHSECECFSRRTISGDQLRGCNLNFSDEVRLEHGGGIRSAELH